MLTIATFSIVCTLAAVYMLKLEFGRVPV